jgi:hypothetical protein
MANSARHEFETRTDKKNPAAMDGVKREFIYELENTCRRGYVNPRPEPEKSNAVNRLRLGTGQTHVIAE